MVRNANELKATPQAHQKDIIIIVVDGNGEFRRDKPNELDPLLAVHCLQRGIRSEAVGALLTVRTTISKGIDGPGIVVPPRWIRRRSMSG